VLGAFAGLEDQLRQVNARVMVLQEIKETQKQNPNQRRKT